MIQVSDLYQTSREEEVIETQILELRDVDLSSLGKVALPDTTEISLDQQTFALDVSPILDVTELTFDEVADLCRATGTETALAGMLQRFVYEHSTKHAPLSGFSSRIDE